MLIFTETHGQTKYRSKSHGSESKKKKKKTMQWVVEKLKIIKLLFHFSEGIS